VIWLVVPELVGGSCLFSVDGGLAKMKMPMATTTRQNVTSPIHALVARLHRPRVCRPLRSPMSERYIAQGDAVR
jgi:hypothetical protein